LAGIHHAGPTVAGAALGMDKLAFGALVRAIGLPALPRILLTPNSEDVGFEGPYIVKPRYGGSSIGIEVVEDLFAAVALRRSSVHLADGAVIEPYRSDLFDLQIAARSWPDHQVSSVERPLRGSGTGPVGAQDDILGYRDKYAGGEGMASAPRELPARIDSKLTEQIREAARQICVPCGLSGVARVDFLSDGNDFWVNEINTIPGSLARYLWIDPPVPFGRLLEDLLLESIERPLRAMSSIGADGSILQGAASIAAKLA
jgi:D-alanine-D-alanine ligase